MDGENHTDDRELIQEIDDTDLDLPMGVGDWLEECLSKLDSGGELSPRDRRRAAALLAYIRENDCE